MVLPSLVFGEGDGKLVDEFPDRNNEIVDKSKTGGAHGMHVAGTVAANGNIEDNGIKGVAPEAQVLAMKVFSNKIDIGTFDDIYLDAIEESIVLEFRVSPKFNYKIAVG